MILLKAIKKQRLLNILILLFQKLALFSQRENWK